MTIRRDSVWDGIGGIVLDAVGTLIEPQPAVAVVYSAAALRQGVCLDPTVVRDRFHEWLRDDERNESHGSLVTDESGEVQRWRRIVENVLPGLPDAGRAFQE